MTMENAYEKEMRRTYFFGDPDSTSNLRAGRAASNIAMDAMNTNVGSAVVNRASSAMIDNAVNRISNNDNDYEDSSFTPRDEQGNIPPTSAGVFASTSEGLNNNGIKTSYAHSNAIQNNNNNYNNREDHKKHVMKEVLGLNRKSVRGKSESEKNQIQLEQRWKNALAEERRLQELEQRVATGEMETARVRPAPNFPRKFLCIKPLVYHDIDAVPPQRQRFVTIAFWNWVAVCLLLIVNAVVAIAVLYAPIRSNVHVSHDINKAENGVLAIVYLIGIPLSFLLWYWRIYNACSSGNPAEHIVAMCGLLIALGQGLFAFIGPRNYGVCGIMLAQWIGQTRHQAVIAPVVVVLFLWLAEVGMVCFLIVKEFIFYRRDLAARREFRRAMPNIIG